MYRHTSSQLSGFLASLFSVAVWSGLVIYYSLMPSVSPVTITAYRVIWSFVFVSAVITVCRKWPVIREISLNKKELSLLMLAGLFIGLNWLAFILAIFAGETVEASMGSYLQPVMGIAAAVFFFKERVGKFKIIAMLLAFSGIAYLIWAYGHIPWYALGISVPFMLYGAVHKLLKTSVLDGFFFEMAVLFPPAVVYLIMSPAPAIFFDEPVKTHLMLMVLGPASALPLITFAYGIQRLRFSTVSVIQYLYPTLTFFIGILYFKEPLGVERLTAFKFIWAGVVIYLLDSVSKTLIAKKRV